MLSANEVGWCYLSNGGLGVVRSKYDRELIRNFIKVEYQSHRVNVLVRKIGWVGSHTPRADWVLAADLEAVAEPNEIETRIDGVLNDEQYFGSASTAESGSRVAGCIARAFVRHVQSKIMA